MADNSTDIIAQAQKSRAELYKQIWAVAEEMRGEVDGWDFKQYFLGTMFYRFVSEDFTNWVDTQYADDDETYANWQDEDITNEMKNDFRAQKGYYLLPSQLFTNLLARSKNDENLNITLQSIFDDFERSALGGDAENDVKGLFSDFDCNSRKLGADPASRNKKLCSLLTEINAINFGTSYESAGVDIFGDVLEYMMGMFAQGASAGEYYTPQCVSKLLTSISLHNKKGTLKVYDPTCGSGSLLLMPAKILDKSTMDVSYYGQEKNLTSYNVCRMNMFLHHVQYDHFDIENGDTLINPKHIDLAGQMDAVNSNPPYSLSWEGDSNPVLCTDPRFTGPGVLAPQKKKADWAFVEHALYMMKQDGCAAIVCFPGIFYRGAKEQTIRKWFVINNYVDAIISLPVDMFYGTSISTCILVLRKNRKNTDVKFIRADEMFVRQGTSNVMTDEHIEAITKMVYGKKEDDKEYIVRTVPQSEIQENDYNLSVSTYVSAPNDEEETDIVALNAKIAETVKREQELREKIDSIISQFHFIDDDGNPQEDDDEPMDGATAYGTL